jgi:ribosome-associated translation inhibitor RaiA
VIETAAVAQFGKTSMNLNIEFKNFAPEKKIQKLLERLIARIEKKAKSFPPNEIFLRLLIEQNPARRLYHVSLTLELPEKTLANQEERHGLHETIHEPFIEIERQLEAHKATLRGEHLWKQIARREDLRGMK